MANEIEMIKEKIEIVDFIKNYLPLQPTGKNFKTLCPFHAEKDPSFIVSPERQIWHCFGCGQGGDVIKFLMLYENLEFHEALQVLAEKAGIEIKKVNPRYQKEIGVLYDINQKAKDFFVEELFKNKEALEYLKSRGLKKETIEEFEVGFSPGGEALLLHLLELGYDIVDIGRSGLVFKDQKGFYRDYFHSRIIFPIFNSQGKIVGFTGRIMPNLPQADELPKYLNTPETMIFSKSKVLYGFHKSKSEIAKTKNVFLVEGQFDVLMTWQSGIKQVVGVSGSNLSQFHLQTLKRISDTIFLSFDKDEAGRKALERTLEMLLPFDFYIKVVDLADYKDPAEAAQKDPDFLLKALKEAKAAFEYLFQIYLPSEEVEFVEKKRILRRLLLLIKKIKSPIEKQNWIKKLASYTKFSENALIEELNLIKEPKKIVELSKINLEEFQNKKERIERIAEEILLFAIYKNEFFEIIKERIDYFPSSFKNYLLEPEKIPDHLRLRAFYELDKRDQNDLNNELRKLLIYLEIEALKKERENLQKEILRLKEEKGEEAEELDELFKNFHHLTQKINSLGKEI